MRVMPEHMIDDSHRAYDKRKYAAMVRRAAWNLLRPFVPEEENVGIKTLRDGKLDSYV
jgi:hypothetical protein